MARRILIGVLLGGLGCTANTSRLEQHSREQAAAAAAEAIAAVPEPVRHTAPLPPAPEGIDAALWQDIGWFPGDVTDISGFVGRESQYLARWLESSLVPEVPACAPLVAGVERTYQAHQSGGAVATNVLYGAMTRAQERVCMDAALAGMGAKGEQRGPLTILSAEGQETRMAWIGREHGTAVVLAGDAPITSWMDPQGTLSPALLRLVAAVERREGTWSVGLRDVGTAFTGVASTGYSLRVEPMGRPGKPLLEAVARIEYASPEQAKQAEQGATEFTRELVGAEDPGIAFEVRLGGSALTIVARGTPSADAAALTAWMGRVQAAMQARLGG